ncbi:uncharacterized protein si:dkey-30e9.6 [Pygocentrus nattereri]|uniref:uncharacterized protein si:dkey-30e9.6 n=1 Tax=Pygocentrus nattereri TaxID=42514 RepID=UPI001891041A|nr:uncharacterized protein si:dkey-30e9.6 [Pygocentrus nattereri]
MTLLPRNLYSVEGQTLQQHSEERMHTAMSSGDILDSGTSIHFNRKLLFSASQKLTSTRGHKLTLPNIAVSQTDLWKIKPPDFSPKLYRSLNLPRIKKKTLNPATLKDGLAELSPMVGEMSLLMLPKLEENRNKPPFITSYGPPGLLELRILFVKSGQFPSIPYKDPKPHNFRPCAEELPDMVTCIEKDPGNLKFKTQSLGAIAEVRAESDHPHREPTRSMDTFKPAELKWDPRLILPKSPWPPKSASYTRHRRRRGVHSAFMDRVEEKLTRSWMKE